MHLLLRFHINPKMQIDIVTLSGTEITIDVTPSNTVRIVKEMVHMRMGYRPEQQRLIFRGEPLKDDVTLLDYNVQQGSRLHLVLRLGGF